MDDTRNRRDDLEESGDTDAPDEAGAQPEDDASPLTDPDQVPAHQQAGYPFDSFGQSAEPAEPAEPAYAYDPGIDDSELEPEREPPRMATFVAIAIVVMAVLGVVMTVLVVKMHNERSAMAALIEDSVARIETAYAGPGASDTAQRRVAWLKRALEDGDYGQAQQALLALGRPDTGPPGRAPGTGLPDGSPLDQPRSGLMDGPERRQIPRPSEVRDLPEEAQQLFGADDELWEAFFGFSAAIAQLERAGADVGALRRIRGSVIEAARLHQRERVEQLLTEARTAVDRMGQQGPQGLPDSLAGKIEQFQHGLEKARNERRDIRAVMQLAQASEEAARQGEFGRAEELMDRALQALKRAPRMSAGSGPMRTGPPQGVGPQPGPELAFTRFLSQLAGQVMSAEQQDLTRVWESINIAAGAIREKNAEQIREILADAREALQDIGQRRREMTAAIGQARESMQQEPSRQEAQRRAAREQQRHEEVVNRRVSELLRQVRDLPQDEFDRHQEEIVQRMLAALTAPVPPLDDRREQPELSPQERVREKMRIAGEMYLALKQETDHDTGELDADFAEVRRLITEHEYEQAEEIVDRNVKAMRELLEEARHDAAGESLRSPAASVDLDGLEIDLRGILEDRPQPAPHHSDGDEATDNP